MQNDGLVSLWQIADMVTRPAPRERLAVHVSGLAGETASGPYCRERMLLRGRSFPALKDQMCQWHRAERGGLVRPNTVKATLDFIEGFVDACADEGLAPLDTGICYFVYERVRRWSGVQVGKHRPILEVLLPYCSRTWTRAGFSLPYRQRHVEPFHYRIMFYLNRELHGMPFVTRGAQSDTKFWRRQQPTLNLLQLAGKLALGKVHPRLRKWLFRSKKTPKTPAFDQNEWLAAKREEIRQVCLDQRDSRLWDFVDRDRFTELTSDAADPAERKEQCQAIFDIATLFYYETMSL